MNKFDLVVADPPWFFFFDELKMSDTQRGASSQYSTLTIDELKKLKIKELTKDNAVLVLWVPSSLLQEGLDVMNAWGFKQLQTFVWVKIKKSKNIYKKYKKSIEEIEEYQMISEKKLHEKILEMIHSSLGFFMGRLFRQTHEIAIIGKKGKPYFALKNRSQRSVLFDINSKHSAKPEGLQDRLEKMFPAAVKLELFARRDRVGWTCIGNQCPSSLNKDIRESIDELMK